MQIAEIRIWGMRGILTFEHRLRDPWLDVIPQTLLVSGLNGSGKTTLLDAISDLWNNFGSALDRHLRLPPLLASCRLAAIKIENFSNDDARPLWLFTSFLNEWNDLKPALEGCHFGGTVCDGGARIRLEFSDQAWAKDWQERRKQSMAGSRRDVPNIVYVTSETRGLKRAKAPGGVPRDEPMRHWHATYDDSPLIHALYRYALTDSQGFADALKSVNTFLEEKRIIGFDDNANLAVETNYGGKHDVYALSTGERQALILVMFAHRWLKPGGILLVDEPDLYLHPSWIEQIVTVLSNLAKERGGQFIFTSHSPILWENFSRDAEQIRMTIKTLDSAAGCRTSDAGSRKLKMTGAPPWVDSLRQKVGSKTVLLVEGSPDTAAAEKWLSILRPDFGNELLVRHADDEGRDREHGGTERVKQGLKHQPDWWGLVDSDERTDSEKAEDVAEFPRLRFLPRYCLESFFIDPVEVWNLLPTIHRGEKPELEQLLSESVEKNLDRWVAHFAMWRTLREREQRLKKELDFPDGVIKQVLSDFPVSRVQLLESLTPWHDHFDPETIYNEYEAVITRAHGVGTTERLRHFVHGKHFFRQVTVEVLNTLGNKSASAWIADLVAATTDVPPDLLPILSEFVA